MPDFACDISFFVGQEKPQIAIATDQTLLFQTSQALLYLAFERQFVSINLIHTERREIINIGFNDIRYVTNQEQRLEQQYVVGFQRWIRWRFINRAFGAGIDKAFDRGVKIIHRHEGINIPIRITHRSRLERIQQ